MKNHIAVFFILIIGILNLRAQDTLLFPGLTGQELLDSIIANYKPEIILDYDNARDTLFSKIDKTDSDSLICVYSGYSIILDAEIDPSLDAYNKGINTEHSWPQSKGASEGNARSDMHHLYPVKDNVNSSRGNSPFGDINDEDTDSWYRNSTTLTTIPSTNIDEYSEKDNDPTDGVFEPREDHKGNVARSMFYFYTMYKDEADTADPDFFQTQKETLYQWHYLDKVDNRELERTKLIAKWQENKENPFVLDTTLIRRAYFASLTSNAPYNLTFSDLSPNGFTISWSLPVEYQNSHNQILVLIQADSEVDDDPTANPVNSYSADSRFGYGDEVGSGSFVVYNGDGKSVTVSNLTENVNYYIKIWNTLDSTEWSASPLTGNQTTDIPEPGSVIISEIMYNPAAVSDADGEWFEIYNTGDKDININGWTIKDNDYDSHTIDNGGDLFIAAGDYLILGINDDPSTNGGVDVDYRYSGIAIANSADELVLIAGDGTTEIDRIEYDTDNGWPSTSGASIYFTGNSSQENNSSTYWEVSSEIWSGSYGDKGSPGFGNIDSSLPVVLLNFSALILNDQVQLAWNTASETDCLGFAVYRKYDHEKEFSKIADYLTHPELAGQFNSSVLKNYSFIDYTLPSIHQLQYIEYELYEINSEGISTLVASELLSVQGDKPLNSDSFIFHKGYPNPFNGTVNFKIEIFGTPKNGSLHIYNYLGQHIFTVFSGILGPGTHFFSWNGINARNENVPGGIYFAVLSLEQYKKFQKIVFLK